MGSFSQTFRVPGTAKNMDVFGPINTSDPGSVNLKTKKAAELFSGSVSILRGFVQVKAVYLQKQHYADIELVFFAGAVDLKAALGDSLLSDLDLSTHDHILNSQNIQASGARRHRPGDSLRPHRQGLQLERHQPPWADDDGLEQGELTPFIQAKVLFDAIMDAAGYTYDSTFFDTTGEGNFDRVYLPCYNGAISPESEGDEDNTIHVGLGADITGPAGTAVLPLLDNIDNARDASTNWENAPNFRYTAPFTGLYSMRIRVPHAITGSHKLEVWVYKNGSEYEKIVDINTQSATGSVEWVYDGDGTGFPNGGRPCILKRATPSPSATSSTAQALPSTATSQARQPATSQATTTPTSKFSMWSS